MASLKQHEDKESGDFHLKNLVETANNSGEGSSSLESTHSAESESASSVLTQIEVISSSPSASSKVIEIETGNEASSSLQNQIQANFTDAKVERDQSSSVMLLTGSDNGRSTSGTTFTTTTLNIDTTPSTSVELKTGESIPQQSDTGTAITNPLSKDGKEEGSEIAEGGDEQGPREGTGDDDKEDDDFDQSYDEDTISSEAVVDDIELILMPETLSEFPPMDLSPQLVRVTELKRPMDYYESDVFEDDEEGRLEQEESDFQKFGTDDEEGEGASERSVSSRTNLRRTRILSSLGRGGSGVENEVLSGRGHLGQRDGDVGKTLGGKVNSGSQTEITALETNNPFELRAQHHPHQRRRSTGKSSSSRVSMAPGTAGGGSGRKHLNWKSELTLLPSKTKITTAGFSGYGELSTNYQDQYSKFTSQDTLNSSSQFLKPSTLYRTRNLSRNLNQCESSESTLVLPAAGLPSTSDSARYRQNRMSSSTSSNFKDSYSSFHVSSSTITRRQPLTSGGQSVSFRSSLPDLSSQPDNKAHRQSFKSMKNQKSSSGYRLAKKSSSDDETSSLIDESERCLRSSIDLLLTDDLPSPGGDFSCRSTGFGGSSMAGAGTTFFGYYSSRRSYSQPLLIDDGEGGDLRDASNLGSPFLPRKLCDMRCSRWAKVILPNGHVAVVSVKEIDEMKDTLTIQTDAGNILCLPFRKIVFAWRGTKR